MDFAHKITALRKQKELSREELAQAIGTSGAIVGRYERGEITPSVEVAARIAQALEVSLDYLVGNTDMLLDKKLLARIVDIQRLDPEQQKHLFALMDAFLRDNKARKAYSQD